jgi:hypothetical protein
VDWFGQFCLSLVASSSANAATASKSGDGLSAANIDFQVRIFISSPPTVERRTMSAHRKGVKMQCTKRRRPGKQLHKHRRTSTFPSDLTPAMDWIFRFELKKVGWVVKDMLGGIGALMPERAGTRFLTAGGRSAGILIV